MYYFTAAVIGLVSGITSGLFGVGGGLVMVPAMLFFLSPPIRDMKQAVGTSLLVIIPTAIMGTWKHFHKDLNIGNVNWPVAFALAPTAIIGGYLGAWLVHRIQHADDLKRAFGGFIILVGIRMLFFK